MLCPLKKKKKKKKEKKTKESLMDNLWKWKMLLKPIPLITASKEKRWMLRILYGYEFDISVFNPRDARAGRNEALPRADRASRGLEKYFHVWSYLFWICIYSRKAHVCARQILTIHKFSSDFYCYKMQTRPRQVLKIRSPITKTSVREIYKG